MDMVVLSENPPEIKPVEYERLRIGELLLGGKPNEVQCQASFRRLHAAWCGEGEDSRLWLPFLNKSQ